MRNDLPKTPKSEDYGVINLDDKDGQGTHWTAYMVSKRIPYNFYFDSFGMPPPKEVERFLDSNGKKLLYNSSQIQNITSAACGWYCIDVIKEFAGGKNPYDILYKFKQNPDLSNEDLI